MTHLVEESRIAAEAAIAQMKAAALAARVAHARAELMRHMLTTARKMQDRPRAEAIAAVTQEWMAAWGLDGAQDLAVAREMEAFTGAFHDYALAPTGAHDAALRGATESLDLALAARGTSLAEEMARRSQCAHGWWEAVAPTPADLPNAKPRPDMPQSRPGAPFWEAGCAGFCR